MQASAIHTAGTNGQPAAGPVTAKPAADVPLDDPSLYINRELSWLEFNRRVLEEAQDPSVPLLERLKFLAIFSSNLDEFFMVRVGGLQQKVPAGIARGSGADRMPPREQLERISQSSASWSPSNIACLTERRAAALEREGIVIRGVKDLTDADRKHLREVFHREIFPVLTPLAIDPGHPFPHLLNKSLNLAVLLQRPRRRREAVRRGAGAGRAAALRATAERERATSSRRWKRSSACTCRSCSPAWTLDRATVFRVTRNSEYEIDDDEVEDLLKTIEEEVRKRRRGAAVRLEIEADARRRSSSS